MTNINTSMILPVDLNALMYMDYMAISEFFSLLGDSAKSEEFSKKAATLKVKNITHTIMFQMLRIVLFISTKYQFSYNAN